MEQFLCCLFYFVIQPLHPPWIAFLLNGFSNFFFHWLWAERSIFRRGWLTHQWRVNLSWRNEKRQKKTKNNINKKNKKNMPIKEVWLEKFMWPIKNMYMSWKKFGWLQNFGLRICCCDGRHELDGVSDLTNKSQLKILPFL